MFEKLKNYLRIVLNDLSVRIMQLFEIFIMPGTGFCISHVLCML